MLLAQVTDGNCIDGVKELTHNIIKKKICSINKDILMVELLAVVEAAILLFRRDGKYKKICVLLLPRGRDESSPLFIMI